MLYIFRATILVINILLVTNGP